MGGKPKPGTSPDKRLKENKGKGKTPTPMPVKKGASKAVPPFGGKKANPFGGGKSSGRGR